jgi:hypothetical protein
MSRSPLDFAGASTTDPILRHHNGGQVEQPRLLGCATLERQGELGQLLVARPAAGPCLAGHLSHG